MNTSKAYAFCQALHKGIEGKDWGEMYDPYKAMSEALGVSNKRRRLRVLLPKGLEGKSPVGHKAAKDNRREEFYDPARKDNILGRNTTRLELWEEHLKDLIVALVKAQKCVEDQY